jgi:biopolymer transport protein TolR
MRRRVREEEEIGELNIVPYLDIVTNLVMFMLLSMVGLFSLGVLDVGTPKISDGASAQVASPDTNSKPQLTLTVGIAEKGFYIAGAGGVLPGTSEKDSASVDTTRPPTVPLKAGKYDYAGLTEQIAKIKASFPDEKKLILVAEMRTPYEVIIETMDATREQITKVPNAPTKRDTLFPEVWLSMMR